jgi:DNA-binding transcriptional regulator LsrR (DeoR family)
MVNQPKRRSLSASEEREKNELAAKVSEAYYIEGRKKGEIARLLNLADYRAVNRYLEYAKRTGIVTVSIDPMAAETPINRPRRDEELEYGLMTLFDLAGAIVGNIETKKDYGIEWDDKLHRALGKLLSGYLQPVIRSGDHIGVCGGRGTGYFAESLRLASRRVSLSKKGITITALAGRVYPANLGDARERVYRLFDADDVAARLGAAFGVESRLLSMPAVSLAGWTSKEKFPTEKLISAREWKNAAGDRAVIPNLAVIGVGVLTEHHRFLDEKVLYQLDPIINQLAELRDIVEATGCQIGDIGYKLFLVEQPGVEQVSTRQKERLEHLIDEINSQIMAPTLTQLRMIDRVVAVAGGKYKHGAIWTALTHPRLHGIISELCTDRDTARFLVSKKEEQGR